MHRPRWRPLLGALCALGLWGALAPPARADVEELELKAELIGRFPSFVEWPEGEIPDDPEAPLVLGILGSDPFEGRLEETVGDRPGRPIEVRIVEDAEGLSDVHVVYVGGSERERLQEIVEVAKREHVLTVSDTAGFAKRGIHVNMYRSGRRVGFEVNLRSAEDSGLEVSSKLLRLARLVEPDR